MCVGALHSYKSFIKSSFNFCPLVWHFCSKTSSAKMEKLQYRALRLVFNDFDSSYETLLERVNMPTLHISRIRLITVETFKILHKMSPVYLQDLLSYKNSVYSFRYDNLVDVPSMPTHISVWGYTYPLVFPFGGTCSFLRVHIF